MYQYAPRLKPESVEQVVERLPVVKRLITIADASCARRQQPNQDDKRGRQRYRRGPTETARGWIGLSDTGMMFYSSQLFFKSDPGPHRTVQYGYDWPPFVLLITNFREWWQGSWWTI